MEINANQKYQEKLSELETRLQSVQQKLSELQGKKGEANRLVASPEVTKAIAEVKQAALRGVRK
jgi:peptidoglycan hydrolase CwlO-like protein